MVSSPLRLLRWSKSLLVLTILFLSEAYTLNFYPAGVISRFFLCVCEGDRSPQARKQIELQYIAKSHQSSTFIKHFL